LVYCLLNKYLTRQNTTASLGRVTRARVRGVISTQTMNKLLVLILLLLSFDSVSKEPNFDSDQAIVIAGVGRHDFEFEEISTGETFIIKGGKKYKDNYFTVSPGRYYLKSIDPIFSNSDNLIYDKPENCDHSFIIKEGHVTYLGEWLIDTYQEIRHELNWTIKRDYSTKYLKKMKKRNKSLSNLPLVISNEEGKTLSISWEKI